MKRRNRWVIRSMYQSIITCKATIIKWIWHNAIFSIMTQCLSSRCWPTMVRRIFLSSNGINIAQRIGNFNTDHHSVHTLSADKLCGISHMYADFNVWSQHWQTNCTNEKPFGAYMLWLWTKHDHDHRCFSSTCNT